MSINVFLSGLPPTAVFTGMVLQACRHHSSQSNGNCWWTFEPSTCDRTDCTDDSDDIRSTSHQLSAGPFCFYFSPWIAFTSRLTMMKLTLLATMFVGAFSFGVVHNSVVRSDTQLGASKGPGNIQRPRNEFSRTYRTESVLGSKQRDYQVSIDASDEERAGLAKRFDLSYIGKLQAKLVMRREPGVKGTANRGK